MTLLKTIAATGFAFLVSTTGSFAATIDTIEANTGFFTPPGGFELDDPYYRDASEDWGWTHNPIASGFTSALLNISAFDVDEAPCGFFSCEVDNIEAYDAASDTWLLLGSLMGEDNAFSFTEFNIFDYDGGVLQDDIVAGLQVRIDIDVLDAGWLVSLGKSVITTDGANPGNPNPGGGMPAVPLPAAGWMLLAAVGALGAAKRRRKS